MRGNIFVTPLCSKNKCNCVLDLVRNDDPFNTEPQNKYKCVKCGNIIIIDQTIEKLADDFAKIYNAEKYKNAEIINIDGELIKIQRTEQTDKNYWIDAKLSKNQKGDVQLMILAGNKENKSKTQLFIDPKNEKVSFDQNNDHPEKVFAKVSAIFKQSQSTINSTSNLNKKSYKSAKDFFDNLLSIFDIASDEVSYLVLSYSKFKQLNESLKNNKDNKYDRADVRVYVSHMVISVFRQIDMRDDVASLRKVLNEIYEYGSKYITRGWFVSKYNDDEDKNSLNNRISESFGENDFEKYSIDGMLDIKKIQDDINKLDEVTREIKNFRHKRIAHMDKNNNIKFNVSFDDLYLAIETIDKLTVKYVGLLKQGFVVGGTMLPTVQN